MANRSMYRERVPIPGWTPPVLAALGAVWVLGRFRSAARRGPAWRAALNVIGSTMTALTLLRALRGSGKVAVEVEEEAIRVAVGPFERRIPARSVRDVRVGAYNPLPFLGWGYRPGLGGRRAFSQIGVPRGVEITTREEGEQHRYFVSSNDPEALAEAITGVAGVEPA